MWKSFCLACGVFACVLGIELLLIDSAVLLPVQAGSGPRIFVAPDWAAWTLLSVGAATIMHFVTVPARGPQAGQAFRG